MLRAVKFFFSISKEENQTLPQLGCESLRGTMGKKRNLSHRVEISLTVFGLSLFLSCLTLPGKVVTQ